MVEKNKNSLQLQQPPTLQNCKRSDVCHIHQGVHQIQVHLRGLWLRWYRLLALLPSGIEFRLYLAMQNTKPEPDSVGCVNEL